MLVVWADAGQVRVCIGEIRFAYDGIVVGGRYLTHDPARQFASPYTYTNWNPTNETDPNGACLWDACIAEAILIGAAVGFAVSAIQAGVSGASFGQAMEAGVIGGAMGGVMGAGLGVLEVTITPTLLPALHAMELAGGAYSTAEGFRNGQYVVGAVGVVSLAFGVYGLSKDFGAQPAGQGAYGGTAQENQAIAQGLMYDQRFSFPTAGGGRVTLTGLQLPDVIPAGADVGDFVQGAADFVNFMRSAANSQTFTTLTERAGNVVAAQGAPGRLFEARLDVAPGRFDPSTGIGLVGKINGLGFPSAAPPGGFINAAATKVWFLLRASGGPWLTPGPAIEGVIRYPSELGLSQENYLYPPL